MGKGTSIEWCDVSWPVVNGCRRVSAGCENCYAERLTATRLSKTPKYQGLAVMGKNGPKWTGETRLWAPHLDLPLTIRKSSRIFVADMGDLFYEGVSDDVIAAVFGVMAACPQHTFQVLTKRPERMRAWFAGIGRSGYGPREACASAAMSVARPPWHGGQVNAIRTMGSTMFDGKRRPWPLSNVWLGVSVEDQATADERIPLLLQTPAAVRFVSYEPALGPVDFDPAVLGCQGHLAETFGNPLIHWIIVGGESGPRARPFDTDWARSTVQQCREAGVACFVKQLGADPFIRDTQGVDPFRLRLADRKGGEMTEWPDDLRVRQFPRPRSTP